MNYKQVIGEAWEFTQENKRLIIWYGFVPSLLTTVVGIFYMAYQFFAFKRSVLFENSKTSFLTELAHYVYDFILRNFQLTIPLIVFGVIFLILYLLLPTLCQASAVQYIARKRNGQPVGIRTSLKHGLLGFLPLFEYHLILKGFGAFSIVTEAAFVLRNLGPGPFEQLLPIFLFIFIVGITLTLFFTFADFFIIIDGKPIMSSIVESSKLVLMHWEKTFFISLLMLIIGLRIILQIIFVLLIPTLVVVIAGYIAMANLAVLGMYVGGIIGIIALLFAAYLGGIVNIFANTVWTFTFLELSNEQIVSARDVVEQR